MYILICIFYVHSDFFNIFLHHTIFKYANGFVFDSGTDYTDSLKSINYY